MEEKTIAIKNGTGKRTEVDVWRPRKLLHEDDTVLVIRDV